MVQAGNSDQALMDSIRIFYQPVVRLADLRTEYVEVLARSENAEGELGGAATIVDAMTAPDRSMELTLSIMERALEQYESFQFGALGLGLAFNLPLDVMLHPRLVERMEAERARHHMPAAKIRFELTERDPVHDLPAARAVITRLRDAGFGLALDDITPGMPHLKELMAMPIRAIKLDRSIVISADKPAQDFVRAMAGQAAASGQDVIAEGIETQMLRRRMLALGVTHGQGFLFSRPLPADKLQDYLRRPMPGLTPAVPRQILA